MTKTTAFLKIWDALIKGLVLLNVVVLVDYYVHIYITTGKIPNLPDWTVSIITIVIIYYFRKGMRDPEAKNGNN